jgi:hypothetical protein
MTKALAANRTRRDGTVRCAIYTRKSSEEGLEQEFNSLQAQREACEAFITSQRHEGWLCLPAGYDDGGFSGATIDRPALQQLLADLTAGRVDIVVVYKIDDRAACSSAIEDYASQKIRKVQEHWGGRDERDRQHQPPGRPIAQQQHDHPDDRQLR